MTIFEPVEPPTTNLRQQPSEVQWPTERWPTSRLADASAARLETIADEAFHSGEARFGKTLALLVVQGGQVVYERYADSVAATTTLTSWSMAKSFIHALVGVLVQRGAIRLAQEGVVPEWTADHDPRAPANFDHLLRMVDGTDFNEDYVDERASNCLEMLFGNGSADMGDYAARLPAAHGPGEVFNYSSGTTNIISRAIAELVGRGDDFEVWMNEVLFSPLGIKSARLTFDSSGTWVGSSYLHATAQDFARFGLLYLRDGVWDGLRILPEGWVDYARTPQACDPAGKIYGAHWWIWDKPRGVFAAQGYETQRILIDPSADAVVVRLGKTPAELGPAVDEWLGSVLGCLE